MSSTHKFGKQRADQDAEFKSKSIWGHEGNPALVDEAVKEGIKAEGADLKDPYEFKSDSFKENFEKGKKIYKEEKMNKLLRGEINEDELSKLDVDRIFGRSKKDPNISPGGIILKA